MDTGILAANGPFPWQNANIFLHIAVKRINFLQTWVWFENFYALYMNIYLLAMPLHNIEDR